MKQIEVQILQQSYLLACPEGQESRLLDAVERVDTAMTRIRDAGKVRARERIAVLAALNLAFEIADRDAAAVPQGLLDDASRHLRTRVDDDAALATLAAIDVLRAEPGCAACRVELRQRLWRLLPTPPAKPTPRTRPTPAGNAYLDALQREAGR